MPISKAEQRRASVCMEEALQYIEQHFGDTELSAQQVADAFHISPQVLQQAVQSGGSLFLPAYLTEKRLLYAYKLFERQRLHPIQEVCQRCGYSSRTYFTSSFKKALRHPAFQGAVIFTAKVIFRDDSFSRLRCFLNRWHSAVQITALPSDESPWGKNTEPHCVSPTILYNKWELVGPRMRRTAFSIYLS